MCRVLAFLVVLSVTAAGVFAVNVKCRQCVNAKYIEDCTSDVTCDSGIEECFMEQSVTDQLTIVYNAGCRSIEVCNTAVDNSVGVGRRRRDLISCSRCCKDEKCNANLCGIPRSNQDNSQCYACDSSSSDSQQPDVHKPEECSSFTICPKDEMCFATTISTGAGVLHRYGCYNKAICRLLMKNLVADFDRCASSGDFAQCGAGHQRSNAVCSACCNDGSCNAGTCGQIRQQLYALYKYGVLDLELIQKNGTLPVSATTLSPP